VVKFKTLRVFCICKLKARYDDKKNTKENDRREGGESSIKKNEVRLNLLGYAIKSNTCMVGCSINL